MKREDLRRQNSRIDRGNNRIPSLGKIKETKRNAQGIVGEGG